MTECKEEFVTRTHVDLLCPKCKAVVIYNWGGDVQTAREALAAHSCPTEETA